ncbi:MAG: helix-turn-helix domain-containing protein [Candidatus Micrarchaeota archaeon]
MKLTRREVEILDFLLGKSATAAEIATALEIKKSNLSRYLKKLASYHLIEIKKEGRSGVVSLEPFVSSSFFSAKSNFPFLKLTDVLVGWTPSLLAFIRRKKLFVLTDIDLAPITSKRLLKRLRSIGMVFMSKRGQYELRKEAFSVADFCFSLLTSLEGLMLSRTFGGMVLSRPSLESARGLEVVYTTENEVKSKRFWPTAFSAFDRYGIHLISAGKYYYTNIKPGIVDVVIHTLALSRDVRNISYVTALMLKNSFNPKRLLKKRQLFDLGKDFISELIKFMETKGRFMPAGFPSWKEVEEIAYAV